MLILTAISLLALTVDPPVVIIDRDNVEISQSCIVRIAQPTGPKAPIIDTDNNGVIHILGSDIMVMFAHDEDSPTLYGARDGQTADTFAGTGIIITGQNVTLLNPRVSGYKVGIHARNADGLTIGGSDVSNNFHQRLKSTPQAEDSSDWLWPHANDNNEWITNYGAGLCVEDSNNVTIHSIRARRTQNGIVLDRANDSKVYDCDCSFLSGWGLAMWRSSRNVISRNAFDFCVRGYSHGVYNRGQDSAGILMFEQCCNNTIIQNSVTHGGDGLFAFAGKEALGEINLQEDLAWYKGKGCNKNRIVENDFSYAAAHGLELTFSFENLILSNRFAHNAICGVWAGYSQSTTIGDNDFDCNGSNGYGLERGGVNIEHGAMNGVGDNRFVENACGIHLWDDNDAAVFLLPWYGANTPKAQCAFVFGNSFKRDATGIHLRDLQLPVLTNSNRFTDVQTRLVSTGATTVQDRTPKVSPLRQADFGPPPRQHGIKALGTSRPTGGRLDRRGRENIIMTEWGPWDHESPLLHFVQRFNHADEYRLMGVKNMRAGDAIQSKGNVFIDVVGNRILVTPRDKDALISYEFSFRADGKQIEAKGLLTGGTWDVWTFPSAVDPREDVERWRREGEATHHTLTADWLDFRFGNAGMSEARGLPTKLPGDHFGVIARRKLTFPPGKWRIITTSDDGIRVWLNDQLVIDDWTWHAPKKHTYDFETAETKEMNMRVEYFELDGHATWQLEISSGV